uniref:Putative copia-type polyprotein n=1 Tax=Aster yellows phytoplasma TaxID=35779 RepID=Q849B8_ASTYP|nr:putative copia-type polyprotein [Aster yellows phytoplasma]
MDRARCLLLDSELPKCFWAEVVNTVTYLLNRSPSRTISSTPEELWSGQKPTLSHVKTFGCKAYAHVPAASRKKLDARSTPCILVGYCSTTKGYRLYNPRKKQY